MLKLTNNVNSYFDFAYLKTGSNFQTIFEPKADLKLLSPYPDYAILIFIFLITKGINLTDLI